MRFPVNISLFTLRTEAFVSLIQILTGGSVIAGHGGAVVNVHLAEAAREAGGAVAVGHVSLRDALAAVLAEAVLAHHGQTLVARLGPDAGRHGRSGTLHTGRLSLLRLEKVHGAGGARSQPAGRVRTRRAFRLARVDRGRGRLVGERVRRTGQALAEAGRRRRARVAVPRTLETRHQTRRRVRSETAHGHALFHRFRSFRSVGMNGATRIISLSF